MSVEPGSHPHYGGSPYAAGSPDPNPQTSIEDLEYQIQELQNALEGERSRRKDERDQAATRERVLAAKVKEVEGSAPTKTRGPMVPRVAGLVRPKRATTPHGERSVAVTTPRTADNLFVTLPDESRPRTPRAKTPTNRGKWGTSGSQLGTAGREISPSGHLSPRAGEGASRTGTSDKQPVTALQVAWNKFCVKARGEFTPPELALVSAETLEELMAHYGFTDAVEKAQIEGQWALLQEGKQTVGPSATPKVVYKRRVGKLNFPDHPHEFTTDGLPPKKSLSARTPLRREPAKPSNPNAITSDSAEVRTTPGRCRPLTPRRAAGSNPNDPQTEERQWKSCAGATSMPLERKSPVRGKIHCPPNLGKDTQEFTPRGKHSEGSTKMGGDYVKPSGIRTGNQFDRQGEGVRRGIRTGFPGDHSPTRTHKPSKIVSTPNHWERSHLTTHQLNNALATGRTRNVQSLDNLQRRTPFALDLGPVSANARAKQ